MTKLSNDYIKWALILDASQTHKEINNLKESTKELEKSNMALRRSQAELIVEGKRNSQEYRNLNKAIKENSSLIKENQAKVRHLTSQLDMTSMSANQLAKRARDLRRDLMDTAQAANPKKFKELRKELDEVNKAYRRALDGERGWRTRLKDGFKSILQGGLMEIGRSALRSVTSLFTSTFSNVFSIIADFEAANSKLAAVLGTTAGSFADLTGAALEPVAPEEMTLKEQILQGLMEAANRHGRSGAVRMARLFATKRL